jgi:hypothetical protein
MSAPAQYTGQAAMEKQNEEKFDLQSYAYTPRAFKEDDIVIKVECCGICGVSIEGAWGVELRWGRGWRWKWMCWGCCGVEEWRRWRGRKQSRMQWWCA